MSHLCFSFMKSQINVLMLYLNAGAAYVPKYSRLRLTVLNNPAPLTERSSL